MNDKTTQKARAIARAITDQSDWTHQDAANLLAMITSPVKEDRELAKAMIRNLANLGRQIEEAEVKAYLAARAANRFEP